MRLPSLTPTSLLYYAPEAACRVALRFKFRAAWDGIARDESILFIHAPKCAGTALATQLYGHTVNHYSARIYKLQAPERFARMITVGVLRHPAERFMSAIGHILGGSRASAADLRLGERLRRVSDDPLQIAQQFFDDLRLQAHCAPSLHFAPQSHWYCIADQIAVQQLYALEPGRAHLGGVGDSTAANVGALGSAVVDMPAGLVRAIERHYADDLKLYTGVAAAMRVAGVQAITRDRIMGAAGR